MFRSFGSALLAVALTLPSPISAQAELSNGYFRQPALHGETLVFVAEGDLWRAAVSGGVAQRLTTHPGDESRPAISPDGRMVAFLGSYEGPPELYVMPIAGGLPRRLTWDGGGASFVGWTADGEVLYGTRRLSTLPNVQLARVDPNTAARRQVPLAQAADGAFAGTTLFFTRLPFQGSHAKRYRGGTVQNLWRWDGRGEATPLTVDYSGTSKHPMPWEGRVYFLSDRDGTMNLWSMTTEGAQLTQHTRHEGWDVMEASLSEGRVAYRQGADLRVLDLRSGEDRPIPIRLVSDFDQMRERWIREPMEWTTSVALSPTGDRVALTSRGQLFVAPVGGGRLVEATRTEGVRYRNATWSPDGRSLVALSDASDEVELWRVPANGVGDPTQLTRDGTILRWQTTPAPDGQRIAHTDKNQRLWIYDSATRANKLIAESREGDLEDLAWSPDSRWLAFVQRAPNLLAQIHLHDARTGRTVAVTTDRYDSYSPAWSPDGEWLWFLSDRHFQSWVGSPWGPRQPEPFLPQQTRIFGLALRAGLRSLFAPATELTPTATPARDSSSARTGSVDIDLEGIQARLHEVPVPPGEYRTLQTDGKRLFWLASEVGPQAKPQLLSMEIKRERPRPEPVLEDVSMFQLSADRKRILARRADDLFVFPAGPKPPSPLAESRVDLSGWTFALTPRLEWRQMFSEAWRLHRDYFWDPGMNAVDWKAMRLKYAPLVDRVASRAELSDLVAQMVSELSTLHTSVGGGDLRVPADTIEPGSLGARTERDAAAGGHRVTHVYRTDPDIPGELAPLAAPGVEVRAGDLIVALNGAPTGEVADLGELLRAQAGKQLLLTVRPRGETTTRDVVVTAIGQAREADLRYDEWEYTRRLAVDSLSGGRIGYVHLRNMGPQSITEWNREYYPVFNREALIVDVRNNSGGNTEAFFLARLMRKPWMYWQPRVGRPMANMHFAFGGPMAMLMNERSASDGELVAEGFRRLGLGRVIGTRSWGGEIWLSASNVLVDRGIATAAETGVYGPEGAWLIEGHGVDPDLVVDNLPAATFSGDDAQLRAAVRELMEKISATPTRTPPPPPYRQPAR